MKKMIRQNSAAEKYTVLFSFCKLAESLNFVEL
jgi:hypothetical protein